MAVRRSNFGKRALLKKDILLYSWLCFSVMHHRTSWLVRIWKLSFRHFKTWQLLCILKFIWSKFIDCGYMTITTRMYILITTKAFQKCKNELHLRINYSLEDSSWLIVKILQGMNGDSDWPLQGAGWMTFIMIYSVLRSTIVKM